MKIKYFLSGRFFADLSHFRRFVDIWPNEYPFPQVISNLKEIKDNDYVFTYGYLGSSKDLILNHDPNRVYIFDNSIFKSHGQKLFRLLNGNLDNLQKHNQSKNQSLLSFYKAEINNILKKYNEDKNFNTSSDIDNELPKYNYDLLLPWSIPLKNIIKYKYPSCINIFESKKIKFSEKKIINLPKKNNINYLSNTNIPILRSFSKDIERKYEIEKYIQRCNKLICPTSSLAFIGILFKKPIHLSKYNPLYNFLKTNPDYLDLNQSKLVKLLADYFCNTNYNVREFYELLEY